VGVRHSIGLSTLSVERYETLLDTSRDPSKSLLLSDLAQNAYDLAHLFLVFYGPLILLVSCYFTISLRLRGYTAGASRKSAGMRVRPYS